MRRRQILKEEDGFGLMIFPRDQMGHKRAGHTMVDVYFATQPLPRHRGDANFGEKGRRGGSTPQPHGRRIAACHRPIGLDLCANKPFDAQR
jgi:hypothetical protein